MMREFLQQHKKEQIYCYGAGGEEQYRGGRGGGMFTRGMTMSYPWNSSAAAGGEHQPELSLGPSSSSLSSSSAASDGCNTLLTAMGAAKNKRKPPAWEEDQYSTAGQTGIELHLGDHPLPPDWEQCLDLQSGRVYYLNRRTLEKTWDWPSSAPSSGGASSSGSRLDLDLNISAPQSCYAVGGGGGYYKDADAAFAAEDYYYGVAPSQSSNGGGSSRWSNSSGGGRGSSNMVAVPCLNCHLLVMLSTSSPSCPNCKYVHSLSSLQRPAAAASRVDVAKPLETLSLLN